MSIFKKNSDPGNYINFLMLMTEKEIKARYKRAVFGFLWVILNPILQMLIIGFIFSFFIKIPNYFLFLFSGLLPWQFFALSLTKATPSFVYERALLQKAKFPREAIPVSIILSNFFNLLVSTVLLVVFLGFVGSVSLGNLLVLGVALVWLLVITIGVVLFTSSLNVRFRDISFFVQTLVLLWFYATPILYNLRLIPEQLRTIFALNPLTSVFELFHLSLLGDGAISKDILVVNIILSLILIVLGVVMYKKESQYFVDWV